MTIHPKRFCSLLIPLFAVVLVSCSRESRPSVHPVHGVVTFQKKPATKAVVVLRPVAPGLLKDTLPHGEVGPDGTFRIGTYAVDDGAPTGEYIVTITWPETKLEPGGGESIEGDRLNGRYAEPTKSPWKVRIKEGKNELDPFRID